MALVVANGVHLTSGEASTAVPFACVLAAGLPKTDAFSCGAAVYELMQLTDSVTITMLQVRAPTALS